MKIERIVVCRAQAPFVEGGAEIHVQALVERLREHGYRTEVVAIPFKAYPKREILAHAAAWRLIDLSESNEVRVDLVIATRFPTYFVRHPRKVTWLIHQYRGAYELCGTPYGDLEYTEHDIGLRETLMRLDRETLLECRRIFTNARNTAARLDRYLGIRAEPLYHPPRLAARLRPGPYGDYVLSVGRVESIKRVDLAVEALRYAGPTLRLVVVGEGRELERVKQRAVESGVSHRVLFAGSVGDDELVDLYAGSLGVVYAPFDEDFGYVTLEAFHAAKPVVTARDSGGTLEFVEDGVNGCVCEPTPEAVGAALAGLDADRRHAAVLGEAGRERARGVTWDGVIERLVGGFEED